MKKNPFLPVFKTFVVLILLFLSACTPLPAPEQLPPTETPSPTPPAEIQIDSVQLAFLETFPLQIEATIDGRVIDQCHTLEKFETNRDGTLFSVLFTVGEVEGECSLDPNPFSLNFPLDILGLPAGVYTLEAAGKVARFELPVANILAVTATVFVDLSDGLIRGEVWHDVCDETNRGDCLDPLGDPLRANGIRDPSESGIPGVEVTLGAGPCPSSGEGSFITNARGLYFFRDLAAGAYCVSVEPLSTNNIPLLIPGEWTIPAPGQGMVDVVLGPGEQRTGIDFGWDFQFNPTATATPTATSTPRVTPAGTLTPTRTPTITPTACLDVAEFVADVSIPDDTIMQPGETFVKTWRFQNVGTCTWGSGYGIVFVDGNQLGAPNFIPFPEVYAPGQTFEFSVEFIAPAASGTFRSNWQMRNGAGGTFGTGPDRDRLFWVQIVVP